MKLLNIALCLFLIVCSCTKEKIERESVKFSVVQTTVREFGQHIDSLALPELYQQVVPIVVRIRKYSKSENSKKWTWRGAGTGFVVDQEKGYIATAYHCIEKGKSYNVRFRFSKTRIPAKVFASDKANDVSLLIIDPNKMPGNLPKLEFKLDPVIGEKVFVIGHPYGITFMLSTGVLGTNIRKTSTWWADFPGGLYYSDVDVRPGNSGGPVFSGDKIIGLVTGTTYKVFAMVIPIKSVKKLLEQKLHINK